MYVLTPGDVHSPVPDHPYIVRSRFDSSDHSDEEEEEEVNHPSPQQGHPLYTDPVDEGSGASAAASPVPEENGTLTAYNF